MGKKLTIFLVDGSETGPRTIEIGNWSGKAVYSQRSSLPKILTRSEFDRPGVYILKSLPNNENFNERIYIGEAENLRKRLKKHLADSDKDFIEIIAFISKDEMLTKSHIKYLESQIIQLAKMQRMQKSTIQYNQNFQHFQKLIFPIWSIFWIK